MFTRKIINYSESSKLSTGCQEHLHKYDTKRVVRSCMAACRHLHVIHNYGNLHTSLCLSLALFLTLAIILNNSIWSAELPSTGTIWE